MTQRSALVVLVLSAALLSGCGGGDDIGAYCDSLKKDKQAFSDLGGSDSDAGKLDDAFAEIHNLADEAPDPVADDWKTLDGAISSITDALNEAGIKLSDLPKLQRGQLPEGVDQKKLAAVGEKLNALNTDEVQKASDNIQKHAKDECGVDLGS